MMEIEAAWGFNPIGLEGCGQLIAHNTHPRFTIEFGFQPREYVFADASWEHLGTTRQP